MNTHTQTFMLNVIKWNDYNDYNDPQQLITPSVLWTMSLSTIRFILLIFFPAMLFLL